MLAFLGALPIIGNIVTAITTSFFNAKVSLVQARIGGNRDVAVKLVSAAAEKDHENTSKLSIMASNKLLTVMLVGFATPFILFTWKVVVWDIVLADLTHGSTDPIKGQVADWATTIIGFLFGSSTVLAIGKMWFGRDRTGE